jgi:hypothetical protein
MGEANAEKPIRRVRKKGVYGCKKYTKEQLRFIEKNHELPRAELTELFNSVFTMQRTVPAIVGICKRNGWNASSTGRFVKGGVPFNKGLKGFMGRNRTTFAKGNIPVNFKEIGSERITPDGYVEIKVQNPNKWRLKHLVVWEKEHGAVPKGHCVTFLDGSRTNCNIANLRLVKRAEQLTFNARGYAKYPKEFIPTLRNVVELDLLIGNKGRKQQC